MIPDYADPDVYLSTRCATRRWLVAGLAGFAMGFLVAYFVFGGAS